MAMTKKTIWLVVKYVLVAAILFVIGQSLWAHQVELIRYFRQAGLMFYGSVLVMAMFLYVQAWIWINLLNTPERQLHVFRGTAIFINSLFAKYLPGAVWNVVGRLMLASKHGASLTAQMKSVYYENVLLFTVAVMYALFLFARLEVISWPILCLAYGSVWVWYLGYDRFNEWLETRVRKIKRWKLPDTLVLSRRSFFTYLVYYLASHLLMGVAFWLLLRSFGVINVDIVEAAGTFVLAWLLGLLSPLPGGLGLREGAMTYLLALQIDLGLAYQIAIVARVWALLAEVALFIMLNAADYIGKRLKLSWQSG
jgi:uncharacterized membrane protein YbhN (UPF0104 family)